MTRFDPHRAVTFRDCEPTGVDVNGQDENTASQLPAWTAAGGALLLAVAVTATTGWIDWSAVGRWVQARSALLGLWILAGLLLAGAGYGRWRNKQAPATHQHRHRRPPLSWWTVAAAAIVITAVGWGATTWLLHEAANATDPAAARVEAIKTGLGIGAGTAGVFALLLAVRRQWHQELTATDTVHDAEARRVTELYTKAAEQLGSDKAPVRLAGLYALERLAQDNPTQRQTIVNLWCAYLRMPYTPPADPDDTDDAVLDTHEERVQEREVRLTAQRLIIDHLQPGTDTIPAPTCWHDIDLDLTGATLIRFRFRECRVRTALFDGATFVDITSFRNSTFIGAASFRNANFASLTRFWNTTFLGSVDFTDANFKAFADFGNATFAGDVRFRDTTFAGVTNFDHVIFTKRVPPPEIARFLPGSSSGQDDT